MVQTATLKVYQRLEGHGRVFLSGKHIADVYYQLKEVQERPQMLVAAYQSVQPARAIYGTFMSRSTEALGRLTGQRLTLQLADGQSLDMTIVKNMEQQTCLVQGLSDVS